MSSVTTREKRSAKTAATRSPKPSAEDVHVTSAQGRRRLVLLLTFTLFTFGLVMVGSASSGSTLLQINDQWVYMQRQATFAVLGFIGMFIAMRVPLHVVQRLARPSLIVSAVLLLAVFLPGVSHSANGATRWIRIGAFQLQPSEMIKLAVVMYLADHLARNPPPRHWFRDFVRSPGGVAIGLVGLIFIQRDLGSSMVTGASLIILYVLAGTNWRLLAGTIGSAVALVVLGIVSEPYRRERFFAFLNPWKDPHADAYQLVQALIAIGSGGPFGVGLGHSVQKIHFLPESHTDMIFAIIAEELGLFGVVLVLGCFAVLAAVGIRIAMRAPTRFASLLAAGITAMLVGQAALNVAGVVGALPLTGVPLPLISYGGSSLIISLTALGLLANVAYQRPPRMRRGPRRVRKGALREPDSGRHASHA